MITKATRQKDIVRLWYAFDAEGQVLGRLAVTVAKLLMGKNKTNLVTYLDGGDSVAVFNLTKIKVTGGKEKKKSYFRYSGYPGGLKSKTAAQLLETTPELIIVAAVKGMLPKNKLQNIWMQRLHVYPGSEHPHAANTGAPKPISKSK